MLHSVGELSWRLSRRIPVCPHGCWSPLNGHPQAQNDRPSTSALSRAENQNTSEKLATPSAVPESIRYGE